MATLGILVDAQLNGKLIIDLEPGEDGVFRDAMDDVGAKVAEFENA